jgi:hypothetical protein
MTIITHVGIIKNLNGIDYNYHSIPDIVTVFPEFLLPDESNKCIELLSSNQTSKINNLLKCLSNEVMDVVLTSKNIKLNLTKLNLKIYEITNSKAIYPGRDTTVYCLLNLGSPGQIQFKKEKTGERFNIQIDTGMLLFCNDIKSEYVRSVPVGEDEKRYVISFNF